ncbi:hypothetical protein HKX48_004243 [Thoreauomyces humboldtii]|nr:hypothetical protein HKX48_004243 [Thoreauomyces humboldtii]
MSAQHESHEASEAMLQRYRQKLNDMISITEANLKHWQKYDADYASLALFMQDAVTTTRKDIHVPLGPFAFVPGHLVHTNEVTVLLGDNWFVERSVADAVEIVGRRREYTTQQTESLERTLTDLRTRAKVAGAAGGKLSDHQLETSTVDDEGDEINEEGLKYVDIREEYAEDGSLISAPPQSASNPRVEAMAEDEVPVAETVPKMGKFEQRLFAKIAAMEQKEAAGYGDSDGDDEDEEDDDEDVEEDSEGEARYEIMDDDDDDYNDFVKPSSSRSGPGLPPPRKDPVKRVSFAELEQGPTGSTASSPPPPTIHSPADIYKQMAVRSTTSATTNPAPAIADPHRPPHSSSLGDLVIEHSDLELASDSETDDFLFGRELQDAYHRKRMHMIQAQAVDHPLSLEEEHEAEEEMEEARASNVSRFKAARLAVRSAIQDAVEFPIVGGSGTHPVAGLSPVSASTVDAAPVPPPASEVAPAKRDTVSVPSETPAPRVSRFKAERRMMGEAASAAATEEDVQPAIARSQPGQTPGEGSSRESSQQRTAPTLSGIRAARMPPKVLSSTAPKTAAQPKVPQTSVAPPVASSSAVPDEASSAQSQDPPKKMSRFKAAPAQGPSENDPTATAVLPTANSTSPAALEPPDGKRYFGAALDFSQDTPFLFNQRINQTASVFEFAMYIPPFDSTSVPGVANADSLQLIDQTESDAIVHLSVFPRNGLDPANFTLADKQRLVATCAGLNRRGRGVLLRFAPQMNVPWNAWGQQPQLFITAWSDVRRLLRQYPEANQTAMVWAPQEATGSPWVGAGANSPQPGSAAWFALGNANEDPYAHYYPDDSQVDWVGLSLYYYGAQYPWIANGLPNKTAIHDVIEGARMISHTSFYNSYALAKMKPMMIAETAAVFVRNSTTHRAVPINGPTELATKQQWWSQYLAPEFVGRYPLVKMICLWEVQKAGQTGQLGLSLDYRVTNVTKVQFAADLAAASSSFIWGNATGNRTTYVPADALVAPPPAPSPRPFLPPKFNPDHQSNGLSHLPQAGILAIFLIPLLAVLVWAIWAICRFRTRRSDAANALEIATEQSRASHAALNPSLLKTAGDDDDVESVDDSATIVNIHTDSSTLDRTTARQSIDEMSTSQRNSLSKRTSGESDRIWSSSNASSDLGSADDESGGEDVEEASHVIQDHQIQQGRRGSMLSMHRHPHPNHVSIAVDESSHHAGSSS